MGFVEVCALVVFVIGASLYVVVNHSQEMNWAAIDMVTLGSSHYIDSYTFGLLRLFFSLSVLAVNLVLYFDSAGLTLTLMTRDGKQKIFRLFGLERFTMFTVWCWTLEGIYFALAAYCSLSISTGFSLNNLLGFDIDSKILPVCWVLSEITFALAYLVTVVVTFVLLPGVKRQGLPTNTFFTVVALLMHNANVAFLTADILLSTIVFNLWHLFFAVLFGCAYVLFQWVWYHRLGAFYYFFLDYERPGAIFWYLGLVIGVSPYTKLQLLSL